ncbi:MAG: prolipoprotein diacylglyceryl transferase [Cytophagales bacterium]|nr:MAG: prolipoprotein diacylglyceryl transferase [Cytophagales bacterium]
MDFLTYIIWDANPEISFITYLSGDRLHPRWYGFLFALGFFIGQYILAWIFKVEKKPERDLDTLLLHMIISTVIGARLGHVLFYEPDTFFNAANWHRIFYVWEGGLASHGAAIAILIALYIYSNYQILISFSKYSINIKKIARPGQSFLWVTDRIVIAVALGGALIRFGNFVNSEIVGKPSNAPTAVIFANAIDQNFSNIKDFLHTSKTVLDTEPTIEKGVTYIPMKIKFYFKGGVNSKIDTLQQYTENRLNGLFAHSEYFEEIENHYSSLDKLIKSKAYTEGNFNVIEAELYGIPCHPAQLYEAIYCLLLCAFLLWLYNRKREKTPEGLLLGLFLIILFTLRFIDEFFKVNQVDFESKLPFNMGQILSIPAILLGLYILYLSQKNKEKNTQKS